MTNNAKPVSPVTRPSRVGCPSSRMVFRKAAAVVLGMFAAMSAGGALAGWSEPQIVSYINVYEAGFKFATWPSQAPCPDGQYYIDWTRPNAKALYALLVVAYEMGDRVAVNYTCDAATGLTPTSNVDVRK